MRGHWAFSFFLSCVHWALASYYQTHQPPSPRDARSRSASMCATRVWPGRRGLSHRSAGSAIGLPRAIMPSLSLTRALKHFPPSYTRIQPAGGTGLPPGQAGRRAAAGAAAEHAPPAGLRRPALLCWAAAGQHPTPHHTNKHSTAGTEAPPPCPSRRTR